MDPSLHTGYMVVRKISKYQYKDVVRIFVDKDSAIDYCNQLSRVSNNIDRIHRIIETKLREWGAKPHGVDAQEWYDKYLKFRDDIIDRSGYFFTAREVYPKNTPEYNSYVRDRANISFAIEECEICTSK